VNAVLVGGIVGGLLGLLSEWLVVWIPAGDDQALEQPPWTRAVRRPPVMEACGALVGAAAGNAIGWHAELVPALLLVGLLVPITFIDIEHRIIPDVLSLPGTLVGLVCWALVDLGALPEHVLAALVGAIVFLLFAVLARLIAPGGMGVGDIKLAMMLGAFLGWSVLPAIFAALILSLVPSLILVVARGRAGLKTALPFGPFLALGGVVGLLWGQQIIDAYLGR
jgi:leader peptidase (prepilin peptidase) / N-methyltransferase